MILDILVCIDHEDECATGRIVAVFAGLGLHQLGHHVGKYAGV